MAINLIFTRWWHAVARRQLKFTPRRTAEVVLMRYHLKPRRNRLAQLLMKAAPQCRR